MSPYHVAIACNGLSESSEAIAWLERGFEEHDPKMVFLNVEPTWRTLRSETRFRTLLKRMKFLQIDAVSELRQLQLSWLSVKDGIRNYLITAA